MAPEGRDPLETDDPDDDRGQTGDGTDQAGRNSQRIPVGCCVDLRRFRDQFRDFGAHLIVGKGLFGGGHACVDHMESFFQCKRSDWAMRGSNS